MQTLAHETTRPSFGRTDGSFLYACQREKIATQFTWEQMGLPRQPALINRQDNSLRPRRIAEASPERRRAVAQPAKKRRARKSPGLSTAAQGQPASQRCHLLFALPAAPPYHAADTAAWGRCLGGEAATEKAKDVSLSGQGGEAARCGAEPEGLPGKCPLPGCSKEVTCGALCRLFSQFYQKLRVAKLIQKHSKADGDG